MKFTTLLIALLVAGCAGSPKLYGEAGLGYQFNADYRLTKEHGGGSNPTAHFEVGFEWENKMRCGYNHWSHLRDGPPFNDRDETHKDELVCTKKFGGQ